MKTRQYSLFFTSLLFLVGLLFPTSAFATQTACSWTKTTGGDWTEPTSWSCGVVPNDNTYDVTICNASAGGAITITATSSITVGKLTVGGRNPSTNTAACNSQTHTLSLQSGSNLTVSSAQAFTEAGDIIIGGRGVIKGGSGTITLHKDFIFSGGSGSTGAPAFTSQVSTVVMTTGAQAVDRTGTVGTISFFNLSAAPASATTTFAAGQTILGTLTANGGGIAASTTAPTITIGATTTATGFVKGSSYFEPMDFVYNDCTQTAKNIVGGIYSNLTINTNVGSSCVVATSTLIGNVTVNNNLILYGSGTSNNKIQTLDTGGYNLTISGNTTLGAGVSAYLAAARIFATGNSTLSFYNLKTDYAGCGSCGASVDSGLWVKNGNAITVNGTWDFGDINTLTSGPLTLPFYAGTSTVTFAGTSSAQTIYLEGTSGYPSFYNVVVNNTASDGSNSVSYGDYNINTLDIDNNLTLTDGALDAISYAPTLSIGGNMTISSSASTSILRSADGTANATTTFDGTTTYTDSLGNFNLGNVFIASSTAAATLTLASNATSTYMNVGSGETLALTKNSNSYTLNLANTSATTTPLAVNGTLTMGTSTIIYKGTGATTITGGLSYYNLQILQSATTFTLGSNATTSNNFSLYSGTFVSGSNNLEVDGTYVASTTTTWTGGRLFLNGTSQTILGTDVYNILQIGASTTIRMNGSSASTYTVDSKGSLYSTDHAGVDGDLYIWGDYLGNNGGSASTPATYRIDYWSYARDFDGTDLSGGSERQVHIYIAPSSIVDISSGGGSTPVRLRINGTATYPTVISRQGGSGYYSFRVRDARVNIDQAQFNYVDTSGLFINHAGVVEQLSNVTFDNVQSGGSYITISSATSTLFATSTTFNNTGSTATHNVSADGTGVNWVFSGSAGTFDGDAYDTTANGASVLWDDSAVSTTTPTSISATSIQWNFTDNAGSEKAFTLYDTSQNPIKYPGFIQNYATGTVTVGLAGDSITAGVVNIGGTSSDFFTDNGRGYGPQIKILLSRSLGKSVSVYQSGTAGLKAADYTDSGPFTFGSSFKSTFFSNATSNLGETPDVTLLLLGANDASNTSSADYETSMREAVSLFSAAGTATVLVQNIPQYSGGVETNSTDLTAYNTILATISSDTGIVLGPDLYNAFKTEIGDHGVSWFYQDTGVHPHDIGFSVMANAAVINLMLSGGNITATPNLSSFTETGLTPNTQYQRVIYPMNAGGRAFGATTTAVYTLAAVPSSLSASVSGSTIVVTWGANSNPDGTEYYVSDTTDGTNSGWITTTTYTFSSPSTVGTHTITIKSRNAESTETTTTSTTVSYGSSGSGGGGSSGGGGGSFGSFGTVNTQTITTPPTTTPTQTATPSSGVSSTAIPAHIIEAYSTSNEVTLLQSLLATDPSIYPEGKITGYYGALTIKAVQNFQKKYNIISSGTLVDGFGRVGPKTLTKIKEIYGQGSKEPSKVSTPPQVSPPTIISGRLTGPLLVYETSEQNKILQKYLAKDPEIYPEGIVSGYYGALTKKAVERFQEKYGISKPGEEFYGYAGPNTRAKLLEVLGK